MFSSLVPRSIPLFGFGRSAGAGEAIKISAVPVHDIETSTDKRARRLKHLLKLNHANHSILHHHLQFHNHTPHHLGSAYLLNGSADHLNAIYEDVSDHPWEDSPGEIALHDWRDFLGKREYQRAFVDFFEDQLVHCGYDWKEVIAEFALKGPDPMINCFVAGLGHPLIHLGYAYELNSQDVAMEALGLVATCYNDLHKYLDEDKWSKMPTKYQTSNPFEVLARVNADDRLKGPFDHIGNNNLSRVFDEYEHVLVEHWNSWKITDPVKQFEQSQQLAVALLISTATSVGGHGYDFFLVHLLTTSHAVRILIPFLPPKFHIPLVRQWWLITVAIYIAQTRPLIKLDYINEVDVGSKDWDWADKQAIEGGWALDAHFVKAVRAIKEAGNAWGDKDDFYLKAAVKFAMEFDGWGGFHEDDPEAEEVILAYCCVEKREASTPICPSLRSLLPLDGALPTFLPDAPQLDPVPGMSDRNARLSAASTLAESDQTVQDSSKADRVHPIIEACEMGDIDTLKRLLSTPHLSDDTGSQRPDIKRMFAVAAEHRQAKTITYLSYTFSGTPLSYGAISAGFATADPPTLRALLEHDRSIVDYEENYFTKLYEFCHGSNPTLALLLLEFGADPQVMPNQLCIPLNAAAIAQPMALIEKLVASGAIVTERSIDAAERSKRGDVVEFLKRVKTRQEGGNVTATKGCWWMRRRQRP